MFRRAGPPPYAPSQTGVCIDNGTIPSPGGKGDREAVDEEWRHLTIRNAVNSNSATFSNVPFSRNAYRFGTDRRSSSAPVCALGHLPPGGRHCAAGISTFQNHPRRGYHILYLISRILYLRCLRLRRRATAGVAGAGAGKSTAAPEGSGAVAEFLGWFLEGAFEGDQPLTAPPMASW